MIDFRYHIVSIAAVFLALALGLVLGSTSGFQNNAISDLDSKISNLRSTNNGLRDSLDRERNRVRKDDDLVAALTPALIAGSLDGEHVVVVSAPGSSGSIRDALEETIRVAGGKVAGEVELQASFFAADSAAVLAGLVDRLAPAVPAEGSALERASAALAGALVVDDKSRAGEQLSSNGTSLLAGFSEAKLVKVSDELRRASLVVVVAAAPQEKPDAAVTGLVTVALALDEEGRGCVVVGDEGLGALNTGSIHALRTDSAALGEVSSVDDGTTAAGRLRTIRALVAERLGQAGQYGIGDGADDVIATPSPAP